jgi:prefoldin subunit 5
MFLLNNEELSKDIKNMTMLEIEYYVEHLKQTIYSLTSTMQLIISSLDTVKDDLDTFNNTKIKQDYPRAIEEKKKERKKLKDEKETNIIDESANEIEEFKEELNKYAHLNEDDEYSNNYFLEAVFSIENTNKQDSILLGKNSSFCVKSVEPTNYAEIKDLIEHNPIFVFNEKLSADEINYLWKNFKDNYSNNIYHNDVDLISINTIVF